MPSASVRPVAGQDLHDLVLARELQLLEALLLHLLLGGEVVLLLKALELLLEVVVLLVVVPQLRLALEQGGNQLLVLSLQTKPSTVSKDSNGITGDDGVSTRRGHSKTRPGP